MVKPMPTRKTSLQAKKSTASAPKPHVSRIIESEADIRSAIKALRRACPIVRRMHDHAGDPPLRRRRGGFDGLVRIIIGQQVSVASANAIHARFSAVAIPQSDRTMSAEVVGNLTDEQFRAGGLSRPKIKTLRAISAAVVGGLDLDALAHIDEHDARTALTAISGIGPWTADVYLMFCLGRADVFAAGDLALQVAAQMAMDLDARPSADELAKIAERWRPWRTVAAGLLWHYYAATKSAKSGQPV